MEISLLINMKMPAIAGIFILISREISIAGFFIFISRELHAQLSWAWNRFDNLVACLVSAEYEHLSWQNAVIICRAWQIHRPTARDRQAIFYFTCPEKCIEYIRNIVISSYFQDAVDCQASGWNLNLSGPDMCQPLPASVTQLDACSTGDQEFAGLTTAGSATWRLVLKYFLWSSAESRRINRSTLVLLNLDIPFLCKQCRSISVGFFSSQLIWICTVCHLVC